jgi:hypothetical protein
MCCNGSIGIFPANDVASNPFAVCHIGELQRTPAEVKEISEFIVRAANCHEELLDIAKRFCARVEAGEIHSKSTYREFKDAIAKAEGTSDA